MAMNGQGMPSDGGRRRQYNHQNPHYPPAQATYNPYMNPYNAPFYPQQQYHPQYHNQGMLPQYAPQYPPYVRSPPPMQQQHYGPPPAQLPQHQQPQHQSPYSRPQQSPAIATSYQPPPPPPPQAPSTVHSHSPHSVPARVTPSTPQVAVSVAASSPVLEETPKTPFRPPLPWFSNPEDGWPARRARRKRKPTPEISADFVQLPDIQQSPFSEAAAAPVDADGIIPRPETPSTNRQPSEDAASTNPTTPSSQQPQVLPVQGETTPIAPKPTQRPTIPAIPIIPAIPKAVPRESTKPVVEKALEVKAVENGQAEGLPAPPSVGESVKEEDTPPTEAPKAWSKPKQWAGLFNKPGIASTASSESGRGAAAPVGQTNVESLAEALNKFNAESKDLKVTFLEPRGLVNTGNMCYMNSVLVFCVPFYNFLDQISKKAVHSFKSDTPLIDSMIMFMREFSVIDSAASVEKLKLRLKDGELEQYGGAFTPAFVYEVINNLPRFSTMRRGHQQDAEEFLGFLLEGLHDECVRAIKASATNNHSAVATPTTGPASPISESARSVGKDDADWQEVGPKQRAAVSRSVDKEGSPITKIFGGKFRSEFRVPGLKDSVTHEPYQPLQLDIGAPNVNNIIDALKALTRSETLHGDFKSPKGPNVTAIKQVFIETVPPVLILHLKRFQYDNTGGTQKIWKKIGYPLELELPKEVFSRKKRNDYNLGNTFPRYRLTAVVYHHGKNASGGHYTVDVRRQDGREWIRLDDTVIRRVRSEDVALAGSEEDPKVLAAALNASKSDNSSSNPFAAIDDGEKEEDGEGWKQASGSGKKWSSVVNGASTPKTKGEKSSVKDNKVAYLLFYQRI